MCAMHIVYIHIVDPMCILAYMADICDMCKDRTERAKGRQSTDGILLHTEEQGGRGEEIVGGCEIGCE